MNKILIPILAIFLSGIPQFANAYENEGVVDFTLPQLHGSDIGLSKYRGKWVVLNYWATWCAPCKKEIPELSDLHDSREDIVVLGLTYEDAEISDFDSFLEKYRPSYPLLLVDVYAPPEPFGAPKVLPTTIILDPQGVPVKTFLGQITRDSIESFIDSE